MNESTPPPEQHFRQGMDYSEIADVHEVHAAVQREKREPCVGREPLSIWLIAIYGLAVFFGGAYLGRYSGNFSGEALDPYGGEPQTMKKVTGPEGPGQVAELSPHDRGKKVFSANCQTCHQANGLGGIERRAAAKGNHAIAARSLIGGGAIQYILLSGIRIHFKENRRVRSEHAHALEHRCAHDARVGNEEWPLDIAFSQLLGQATDGACSKDDGGRE